MTASNNSLDSTSDGRAPLRLALPKGRMQKAVFELMAEAGLPLRIGARAYRPKLIGNDDYTVKLLKPHNIIEMLHQGSRDLGFAGADWVHEFGHARELVELLDTGFDPVRLVAAVPHELLVDGQLPDRPLVVATEYVELSRAWVAAKGLRARIVKTHGATEVFPPEDADFIIDNTSTGATLEANGLQIFDTVMTSSTRLYASPGALECPTSRKQIDDFVVLLRSVLEARKRVMIEVNVPSERLQTIVDVLPCMRNPTIASLHGDSGYAVKAAVPRDELASLIARIRDAGGSDIVVTKPTQILP